MKYAAPSLIDRGALVATTLGHNTGKTAEPIQNQLVLKVETSGETSLSPDSVSPTFD